MSSTTERAVADDGVLQPDAYVLSAPAIDASIPAWQWVAVRGLGSVAPRAKIGNRIQGAALSRDPSVGGPYNADPLTVHSTTARFALAAFGEQARVSAALHRLAVPALVIHGGDDRLVPTASSERLAGLPGVTRGVYPGLRHEVHNEPEGLEIVDDVAVWLRLTLVPEE
jgi:acylglycerol lipase